MNNLVKRTIFGSLFVIVVIGSILVNFWAFFIVMTASVFLGVKEVNRLLSKDIESKSELPSLIYSMSVFVLSSVVMCADVPFNLGVFAMFSFQEKAFRNSSTPEIRKKPGTAHRGIISDPKRLISSSQAGVSKTMLPPARLTPSWLEWINTTIKANQSFARFSR